MRLHVCWCESQKKEDQGRAESEVSGGSHGHWGTRRKFLHDFAALPLYYKEGNVGCV